MDEDRIGGKAKEVKGSVREALGTLTGNNTMRAQGAAEKAAGKAQAKAGGFKDRVRAFFKR